MPKIPTFLMPRSTAPLAPRRVRPVPPLPPVPSRVEVAVRSRPDRRLVSTMHGSLNDSLGFGWDDIKAGWDAVTSAFSSSTAGMGAQDKVASELNRVLTVYVGVHDVLKAQKAAGRQVPASLQSEHDKLWDSIRWILRGICEQGAGSDIRVPAGVGFDQYDACVTLVTPEEWRTFKTSLGGLGGVSGLGLAPLVLVVVAAVAALSTGAVVWLTTGEGRRRMDVALATAAAAEQVAKCVANGTCTPSQAETLMAQLPKTPEETGGMFGGLTKLVAVGAAAYLAVVLLPDIIRKRAA